jgi:hypothetical protein
LSDPTLKLELDYCVPKGVPHSVFLGWDVDDRNKALWWVIHDRQRCPNCGTRPDEWNEAQGGDLHAYVAEPAHCRGCEVAAQGDEWFDRHRKEMRRGTTMRLVPRRLIPDDQEGQTVGSDRSFRPS